MVRSYAVQFGGILTLSKDEEDFLSTWEAEDFRKKQMMNKK